jgi:hypothetical protein
VTPSLPTSRPSTRVSPAAVTNGGGAPWRENGDLSTERHDRGCDEPDLWRVLFPGADVESITG